MRLQTNPSLSIFMFNQKYINNKIMWNNPLIINKIDLVQSFHYKKQIKRQIKTRQVKTRQMKNKMITSKHPFFQSQKNLNLLVESQAVYSPLRSFSSKNMRGVKRLEILDMKNNYKSFPARSLIVKPHVVKNTTIRLNLFHPRLVRQFQEPIELVKQLNFQYTQSVDLKRYESADNTYRPKNRQKRAVSAYFNTFKSDQSPKGRVSPWNNQQSVLKHKY